MREKLIEILQNPIYLHEMADPTEALADYLLDNGVVVQKHGRWVKRFCHPMRDGEWQYICSACKDDDYWNENVCIQAHNYCPNCGAKMDGDEHEP